MTLQILISTMFEKDYSLLEKMNINNDCVVVNQTDEDSIKKFIFKNFNVIWINSMERGLSKSRNLALKYASGDIILLADNDEILFDSSGADIINQFIKNKKADLICFNIKSIGDKRKRYVNKKCKRLNFFNIFRYGSARIAFKLKFIKKNRITFNENFGAGTENGGGEDSLFLNDFLKNNAKCFSNPLYIGNIDDTKSTWFSGYNEQYFVNIGKFLYVLTPNFVHIKSFLFLIRSFKKTKYIGFLKALKSIYKGIEIKKAF